VRERHALANGVERRGADVAIDDAERAERQLGEVETVRVSPVRAWAGAGTAAVPPVSGAATGG